jgi:predicted O-methyltransferase YrrM
MEFLPEDLDNYIQNHTQNEPELLVELNRKTNTDVLQPRMLSGHLQGRVLSMLSNMIKPKCILEIGTYTGYSAICLAEGLAEGGKLITIDINEELEDLALSYFHKANLEEKITMKIGDATLIIPELGESLDLVFIDADKENYSNYFHLVIDKLNIGGYIIADNVLWSGKVIEEAAQDQETTAIRDFNTLVQNDERVENVLMPIRDGLQVIRKIK